MPTTKTSSKSDSSGIDAVRIAITSFQTEELSWSNAANGTPDLSKDRYKRIVRLANAIVKTRPKPHYVVFPELAIPRAWARTLAHHFLKEGISLITGVEYARSKRGHPNQVVSDARLYLTDNRLGYPCLSPFERCSTQTTRLRSTSIVRISAKKSN